MIYLDYINTWFSIMDNEIKMLCENLGALQLKTSLNGLFFPNDSQGESQRRSDSKTIFNAQSNTQDVKLDIINDNILTLKQINISRGLTKIPNVIFNCKYLIELNLSNNSLEVLPEEIGNLCNLITLNLSFNKLNCLPKSLTHIHQLSYLNVSNNKFFDVPDVLYWGLKTLKFLDLSSNEITVFDDTPRCLNTLLALEISKNSLKKLPFWLFDSLCQLKFLCLNENQLHLETEIVNYYTSGMFDSLQCINIENCNLSHKDFQMLSHFKNLIVLKIGNKKFPCEKGRENYLGGFKMEMLKKLSKLRCLYIQNAHIPSLPSDFGSLNNIEVLDLSGNLLTWLPECFCNLFNLKILNLSSNLLLFLPENIDNFVCLQQIHLANNNLYKMPERFYHLSNLEFIDIYNNKLEKFEINIFQNTNLKGIDLGLNSLHFEICDCCDNNSEIKKHYNLLKESFRKHFNYMDSRCDLQEVNVSIENNNDSRSVEGSIESESISEYDDFHLNLPQDSICLDENWEEDSIKTEEDELFDPNVTVNFEKSNNIWSNFHNNYCPAKQHKPSVQKRCVRDSSTSNNETVEDGQFDSD